MRVITFTLAILLLLPSVSFAQTGRELTRDSGTSTQTQKRTALVIGNGAYRSVSPLGNPANDATDMTAALKNLGFDVMVGTDANLVQMRRLIREFGEKLRAGKGVGLFYYAGHGVEVKGRNFLVPVDADIASEVETEDYAIDIDSVLRQMDSAGNGFNVVILDACRNNPFSRGWSRSSDTGGLANVLAPTGTYIAFAAAPGSTASDGKGTRNGIFTGALLKNVMRPNLKLEEVFKATREDVMTLTANKQVPWDSSSIKGDFYFARTASPGTNTPTVTEKVTAKDAAAIEREAWSYIQNSTDAQEFRAFLKDFPNGANAGNAKIKLEQSVWDSVKDSKDKIKIQAYMDEFPSGPNVPLAKIKLRQAETPVVSSVLTSNDGKGKPDVIDGIVGATPVETVNLNVWVTDKNGRPIENLHAKDFKVFEDGVDQEIDFFSKSDQPISYALVVDNSASMRTDLELIIEAGKAIVGTNRSNDETEIIRFVGRDKITIEQPFTARKSDLNEALDNSYIEGGQSALIDSIYLAVENVAEYKKTDDRRLRAVILISDGDDRDSYYNKKQLLDLVRETNIQIYSLGLLSRLNPNNGEKAKAKAFLEELATETGGAAYFPTNLRDMESLILLISQQLHSQYSIVYSPTSKFSDLIPISVTVADGPNNEKRIVSTRKGRATKIKKP